MARPRKLNLQKQGHRTKEELQEAENVENGFMSSIRLMQKAYQKI